MARFELFLCVLVELCSLSAETTVQKVYFVEGKTLELRPTSGTETLTNVLWKFTQTQGGTVLVAEWTEGDKEVEYYLIFKESAHLDTATGVLTVKPTNQSRAGVWTVEVNQRLLDVNYEATVIEEVPTPKVWMTPGNIGTERTLSCTGDVSKAEPVSYWWDINPNKTWVQMSSKITLQKNDTTKGIMDFSCKVSNPVGEKESAREPNPFYTPPAGNSGLWALMLVPVIVIAIVVGIIVYKIDYIREHCFPREVSPGVPPGGVALGGVALGAEASENEATSATPSYENLPLRQGDS